MAKLGYTCEIFCCVGLFSEGAGFYYLVIFYIFFYFGKFYVKIIVNGLFVTVFKLINDLRVGSTAYNRSLLRNFMYILFLFAFFSAIMGS